MFQVIVFEGRVTEVAARIKINGTVGLLIDFSSRCCQIRVLVLG